MAQTIQIKRSTGTAAPTSLANGELAYLVNTTNNGIGPAQKLYIGRPGGGTGDIDEIGGKDTVDKANNALPKAGGTMTGAITFHSSQTFDGRDVSADGSKLDGIEANADVTDSTNVDAAGAVMNTDTTTASMSFVVDEDNMSSDSNTKVPTQQSVKAFVENHTGNFVFNGSTLELTGGSTMTIGASNGSEAISIPGSLTISGNLNVTGDVNSTSQNNLDVTDKLITVGVGQSSGAASAGSGIKVDGANARLLWSSTQFEIDDGDGNLHGVIHEGNSATQTYTIDGGTF